MKHRSFGNNAGEDMSAFQVTITVYFAISLALLLPGAYLSLRQGKRLSIGQLIRGFLFGPLMNMLVLIICFIPPPSAPPIMLICPKLSTRQGKTATQIACEMESRSERIGGMWPRLTTMIYLGVMTTTQMARQETLTARDFGDRFKEELKAGEIGNLLSWLEIQTGQVQVYYLGNPPNSNRRRFWMLPTLMPRGI